MRLRERGGALEVVDVPGLHWLLGLLFVGLGILFMVGSLLIESEAAAQRWWLRPLVATFGGLGAAAGLWTVARAPRSCITIDRSAGSVRLKRSGIGGRATREWPLAALSGVELVEESDDEGGEVFQIHLLIGDESPVPISPVWRHGRKEIASIARRLADEARVPTVNVDPRGS